MKFLLFDRWDHFLHEPTVLHPTHYAEINGEDRLEFITDRPLSKGDRIVWHDSKWREHVVDECDQTHDGTQQIQVVCIGALQWDFTRKHVRFTEWSSADCQYALNELVKLRGNWTAGVALASPSKHLKYEKETAYQALQRTAGAFFAQSLCGIASMFL